MGEWPEQPRLTDALQRLADDTETRDDHRQAVLARLLQTPASESEPAPRRRRPHRRAIIRDLPPSLTVASVAIAAIAVISGLVIANRHLPTTGTTVQAGERIETADPSTPPSISTPEGGAAAPGSSIPELTRANLCGEHPQGPLELEYDVPSGDERPLTIGVEALGGWVTDYGGVSLIDFGDASDWDDGRQLEVLDTSRVWLAFRVPPIEEVATMVSVLDTIVANGCHSAVFAAIPMNVMPTGAAVSCREVDAGRTVSGVLLLDPDEPPSTCPGTTPTLVAGADLGAELDAWAAAYGCRSPSSKPLVDRATIVTFADCRHTLAVVDLQRPIDDVWTDPDLAGAVIDRLLQLR